MSHEIEVFKDGSGSMFSARETPWHNLGTVTSGALTAEDAMKVARLDWTVEKHPIQSVVFNDDGVTTIDVPGKYATVRTNPETKELEALGVVGENYTVVQNLAHATFLNNLVDESGAHFETAGSLHNGRRVFVSMKMPKSILIGGVDKVDMYLVASGSHDGSTAFTIMATPIRVVCQNTLNFALKRSPSKIALRHTSGVTGRIQEVRDTLKLTFAYADEFQAMAEFMMARKIETSEFEAVVDKLWTPTFNVKNEPTKQSVDRKLQLKTLFTGAETNEFGRGTSWGGLNAITEYLDHYAPVSGAGNSRSLRVASGQVDDIKNRALVLLSR